MGLGGVSHFKNLRMSAKIPLRPVRLGSPFSLSQAILKIWADFWGLGLRAVIDRERKAPA
jgi:hypothetical protein